MMSEFAPVMAACEAGRHDDALQLLLALFERADHSPHDDSLFFITMFQWGMMLKEYPPARVAMRRVRDEQAARLLAGEIVFGATEKRWPRSRFQVIAGMDGKLGASRATYELFLQLRVAWPQAAQRDAFLALEAMVEAGDYALAETYLGDPLAGLDRLNECALTHVLIPPSRQPPRLAAELTNFSKDVRLLCVVHRGLGRADAADTLRTAALAGIVSDDLRAWAVRELDEPGALFRELSARDEESL
ncbi:hypothetical protein GJ699_11165 [Duganella sp. FT80W]|uniref:Tetratricopeptide repeat protein n=1 Tax=Duganella guangzhouensis TaxID=2666084 RepID=A0A6I2L046_9BURK|nr:hypothetical protein [Duganella guangzhouensis]MRW90547.1 hypothetical protein [Duganella guangzhouensis]